MINTNIKNMVAESTIQNPYLYISDVTSVPTSTNTVDLALANPILSFQTPPSDIDLYTLAIAWDSNTQLNYRWLLKISSLNDYNPIFKKFPASGSINIFDSQIPPVRIRSNSQVELYAYNFNSATSNGNLVLYMLGELRQ